MEKELLVQPSQEIGLMPKIYTKGKSISDFDTFFYDLNSNICTIYHLNSLIDEVYADETDFKSNKGSIRKINQDHSPTAISATRVENFYQAAKTQSIIKQNVASIEELPKIVASKRSMVDLFLKSIKNVYFVNVSMQSYCYRDSLCLWLMTVTRANTVSDQFRYFFDRSVAREPLILLEPVTSFILSECNIKIIKTPG